jgi:hypothetical protein
MLFAPLTILWQFICIALASLDLPTTTMTTWTLKIYVIQF